MVHSCNIPQSCKIYIHAQPATSIRTFGTIAKEIRNTNLHLYARKKGPCTSNDPTIVMGKLITTAFVSADVCIPTEKVGCLQVTSQLKEFLKHYPQESREKAFEQIYKILQMPDAYLIDNPQQHLSCMSPDSEYILLIMYATKIEIDLCNFPAIWAVLSILLDTQSNELQHVKNL